MARCIGVRREDKNRWEARAPLTPDQVAALVRSGVRVKVQPSSIRAFEDSEYAAAGAEVEEDLSDCNVIMGVKEMPAAFFEEGKLYVFFSHTIKGQRDNMPMLQALMDKGACLVDYEKITDEQGRRLVFFGRHAGLAGMIDTLWALGRRLKAKGISTPFEGLEQAYRYGSLEAAKEAVASAGRKIARGGLPPGLAPLVVGFAGYGNVSQGAQEILDMLPVQEVAPEDIASIESDTHKVFKVVFQERHMVRPRQDGKAFDLQDYYDHPERYEAAFEQYLPSLSVLVNCIFWTDKYPRLVTREWVESAWRSGTPKLEVIGDISCDIGGAVQVTVKATDPGDPVFVFDVDRGDAVMGFQGKGPVILAVDNLPCELPKEATAHFSRALSPFLDALAAVDPKADLDAAGLPPELKRAVIVWKGGLTPEFAYIDEFLRKVERGG